MPIRKIIATGAALTALSIGTASTAEAWPCPPPPCSWGYGCGYGGYGPGFYPHYHYGAPWGGYPGYRRGFGRWY